MPEPGQAKGLIPKHLMVLCAHTAMAGAAGAASTPSSSCEPLLLGLPWGCSPSCWGWGPLPAPSTAGGAARTCQRECLRCGCESKSISPHCLCAPSGRTHTELELVPWAARGWAWAACGVGAVLCLHNSRATSRNSAKRRAARHF